MYDLIFRHRAIELRKQGKTYHEIQEVLGRVPKSTISAWLKPIDLTTKQLYRVQRKMNDAASVGRLKAAVVNHRKRLARIARIKLQARREFSGQKNNPLFWSGLMLYLAEGARKSERFQFMNSDPHLVRIMITWLTQNQRIPKSAITLRLYSHKLYAHENHQHFWSTFLSFPLSQFNSIVYKPMPHTIKKNPDYRGCLRVDVSGSELFWKIIAWRDIVYLSFFR